MSAKTTKETKKLAKRQREILDLLQQGYMIEIDKYNTPSICGLDISPQSRYFMTENRFVTRKDKTKTIETKGNGFVITEKGMQALEENPLPKRKNGAPGTNELIFKIENSAKETSSNDFINTKWYVLSVAKHILKEKWASPKYCNLPDSKIDSIIKELVASEKILKSLYRELEFQFELGRLSHSEFIKFGEYTDSDGYTCNGVSKNTIVFKKARELINSEFGYRISKNKKTKKNFGTETSGSNMNHIRSGVVKVLTIAFKLIATIVKALFKQISK